MQLRLITLAILYFLSSQAPARADWQYTKWGMSPNELVRASAGKAVPNTDTTHNRADAIAQLTSPYTTGGFSFVAYFLFERDKLVFVDLELTEGSRCADLYGGL